MIRYTADRAYLAPDLFTALSYGLRRPVIGNLQVYDTFAAGSAVTETALHRWIDATKAPVA